MKTLKSSKFLFGLYLVLFFFINILQSYYTELIDDEAYYWLWSKHLDWGYFDHPPMVALWIKISSFLFDGELGVRFFSTFMFGFTVFIVWNLIDLKEKWQHVNSFFLLITAVILFNFYGFITVPDTPLLFFVALFLWAYKWFLTKQNLRASVLLGIAMAGMLYSKYHGVLVIAFVVLSNLKLLKNKLFWFAVLWALILFTPHILWQYEHGFPSVLYHLNRSKKLYQFVFSINHLLFQLLIVGVAFPVIYLAFFKSRKQKTLFAKALQYIVIGVISFFFLSTFKTSTQPQWTVVILIPLVVLVYPIIINSNVLKKWFYALAGLNLILLIGLRVFLADENLSDIKWETHQNKSWAKNLKLKTEGLPIVFYNSFQDAAKYQFYTGIESYSFNDLHYRQNQFDLWKNIELGLQGKTIYEVRRVKINQAIAKRGNKNYAAKKINNYTTYQHLTCIVENPTINLHNKKQVDLELKITNPYDKVVSLKNLKFYGVFQTKKHQITATIDMDYIKFDNKFKLQKLSPHKTYIVKTHIIVPKALNKQTKTFRIGLGFYDFYAGFQGNPVKIIF